MTVSVFVQRENIGSVSALGLQQDDKMMPQLLAGVGAGIGAAGLVVLLAILLGGQLRTATDISADLIVSEALIAVPVAVIEELAYRGYLMTRAEEIWGRQAALVGTSLFFAAMHFSWWLPPFDVPPHLAIMFTINIFVGGCVLGLSYYWSDRRLWAAIGFHFAWNMIAYVAFPVYPRETVTQVMLTQIEWGVTTLAGFAMGALLMHLLLRKQERRKTE